MSKVLANRIRPHLPDLVSNHQTAFVKGRLIAENFLTTREVLHDVHRAASPAVLLKLDFAKAYDTLNWDFLMHVLTVRGFPPRMLQWILRLLNTATSRIEINGQSSLPFKHKRGLRQGDPLSPYLFILAADVFQRMTANVSIASPYRLSPRLPFSIINFQYADDTVLIASTKGSTLRILMLAVHAFTAVSGLKINFEKSSFVPLSINTAHLQQIEDLLQCKQQQLPITYLGMPLTIKKPTRNDFMPLLHRLERRLQGWQARFISRAGRLQLIKSVLTTIPAYFMSCFQFPKWLLARIDAISRNFLWATSTRNHPVHLVNWQVVCLPQRSAGMGVINLRLQNMAFMLRWLWRLYETDRMLWGNYAAMLHALRPTPDGPLILSASGSFFWRSLLKLKPLFHSCARFHCASGKRVSFWFDAWSGPPLATATTRDLPSRYISLHAAKQQMNTLFTSPLTSQHHNFLDRLTAFIPHNGADVLQWNLSASGIFSVSSVYKILSQGGRVSSDTVSIWKAKVTPSMRCFFFLLINDKILTHDVMQRRKLKFTPGCVLCDRQHEETAVHLFFTCRYSRQIWLMLASTIGDTAPIIKDSVKDTYRCSVPGDRQLRSSWTTLFITALWFIWRERNHRIFRGKTTPGFVLANRIKQEAHLYRTYC